MYKSEVIKIEVAPNIISVRAMPVGRLGILRGGNGGIIVLRTYDQIVNVADPRATWTFDSHSRIEVELLPEGTVVRITSGDLNDRNK
jgi:hypothetical protein